jgi:hypothetical protein
MPRAASIPRVGLASRILNRNANKPALHTRNRNVQLGSTPCAPTPP